MLPVLAAAFSLYYIRIAAPGPLPLLIGVVATVTTYFLPEGTIEGARDLQRAHTCLDEHCRFTCARFELDDPAVNKHFEEHSWAWNDNPFLGTPQLHGLKVLVMLLADVATIRDVVLFPTLRPETP